MPFCKPKGKKEKRSALGNLQITSFYKQAHPNHLNPRAFRANYLLIFFIMPFGIHRSQNDNRARSRFFDLEGDRLCLPYPVGHHLLHTLPPLILRFLLCGSYARTPEERCMAIEDLPQVFELLKFWCRNIKDEVNAFDTDVKNSATLTAERALSAIKCHTLLRKQMPRMQQALLACKDEAYKAGFGKEWGETSEAYSMVEGMLDFFIFPPESEVLS